MVTTMDIGMVIMHLIIMTMGTTRIIMVIAPQEEVPIVPPIELVQMIIMPRVQKQRLMRKETDHF